MCIRDSLTLFYHLKKSIGRSGIDNVIHENFNWPTEVHKTNLKEERSPVWRNTDEKIFNQPNDINASYSVGQYENIVTFVHDKRIITLTSVL